MTCYTEVSCPHCGSTQITRAGKSASGEQRYRCRSETCATVTFMLNYRYAACYADVPKKVVDMATNSRGIRDTARVLGISKNTVISLLKKASVPVQVNPAFQPPEDGSGLEVSLGRVCVEAELDEQWSFVQSKSNQRWLPLLHR